MEGVAKVGTGIFSRVCSRVEKANHFIESIVCGFLPSQFSQGLVNRLSFIWALVSRSIGRFDVSLFRGYDNGMLDWSTCPVVERDPERVSGAWVFRGTRIPVSALFENLEDGGRIDQFVEWFPGVTIEQVRAVLDHAAKSLTLSQVA
jgi:uncharacterized protein (DUF433 family)